MFGLKKSIRLDLLSGAKIIRLHKQYLSMKGPIETPPIEIRGTIVCKDLSPKRNYASYVLFTGPPRLGVPKSTQWVYNSSSGYWEMKLGEFNTGVGEDRVKHFLIYDINSVSLRNNLIFVGIY